MAQEDAMKDVNELQRFVQLSERPNVRKFLETEVQRLLALVPVASDQAAATATQSSPAASTATASTAKARETKAYAAPIKTYGFEQTSTEVKIYVTLNGVGAIPREQVSVKFEKKSFSLLVESLDSKNHTLSVRLGDSIKPDKSSFKVRKNAVYITLVKSKSGNWESITATERRKEEEKKEKFKPMDPKPDDPSAGMMDMMKKMYDEGDDEMKRMLAKAWSESRDKQSKGDFGSA